MGIVSGRYYAMDRDKRWERLVKAYDAMTVGEGMHAATGQEAIEKAYERDENDEFVLPTVVDSDKYPNGFVNDGDSIIMFNFRPDRAREITRAFMDPEFDAFAFERKKKVSDICYICMTQYDAEMPNVTLAYPPETPQNTLGVYISNLGMKQLRIAETEKYAHVTFFPRGYSGAAGRLGRRGRREDLREADFRERGHGRGPGGDREAGRNRNRAGWPLH